VKELKLDKKEVTLNDFIATIELIITDLEKYFISITPRKAYNLLTDSVVSSDFVRQLTDLQSLYGIVVSMHPESLYEKESKERTIFENIINEAEELSKFIDSALEVYHLMKSRAFAPLCTQTFCYTLMLNVIEGTRWSFYGIILQIISKSKKIVSFFKSLAPAEYEKGRVPYLRKKGKVDMSKILGETIELPPSLKRKLGEGEK
jgi:hypothetical protein